GAAAIAKRVHTEQQRTVQGAAGSDFRVRPEAVFQPVAEKQFVSEYFLHAIEDGLTRDISLSRNGERTLAGDRAFGRHWIHPFYIGVVTTELQGVADSMSICCTGGAYRRGNCVVFAGFLSIRAAHAYRMDRMAVPPPVP